MYAYAKAKPTAITALAALSLALFAVALAAELGSRPTPLPEREANEGRPLPGRDWQNDLSAALFASSSSSLIPSAEAGNVSYTDAALSELVGSYIGMKKDGTWSGSLGTAVAESIANSVSPPLEYLMAGDTDIKTGPTKKSEYKTEMELIMRPLYGLDEPEFATYARFIETGDDVYLEKVRSIARTYAGASQAALRLVVPDDARSLHRDAVNALAEFGAALDALVRFSEDPIASMALLRAYNDAEKHMFSAFGSLHSYFSEP